MRELADPERIRRFMRGLGERAESECRVYFTGGASAVLEGWRQQTIAWSLFRQIEPRLYRFPAIDPARFRRAVADALGPDPAGSSV